MNFSKLHMRTIPKYPVFKKYRSNQFPNKYWSIQFPTVLKQPVSNNIEAPSFKHYRSTQFQTLPKHPVSNTTEAPSFPQYRSNQFPSNYWSRQFPSNTSSNINQNNPIEPSLRICPETQTMTGKKHTRFHKAMIRYLCWQITLAWWCATYKPQLTGARFSLGIFYTIRNMTIIDLLFLYSGPRGMHSVCETLFPYSQLVTNVLSSDLPFKHLSLWYILTNNTRLRNS